MLIEQRRYIVLRYRFAAYMLALGFRVHHAAFNPRPYDGKLKLGEDRAYLYERLGHGVCLPVTAVYRDRTDYFKAYALLADGIGNITLSKLTVSQVQSMYNSLFKSGLSAKSVKCTHGVLHEALDKAVELGYIADNVTENCSVPKLAAYEMKPMKSEEVGRFLEAIKGHRYEDVYYTALFTGMRESELMGLTWDCVDLDNGTIRIYRQLQRTYEGGKYEFRSPKNRKSRIIKPARDVIDRLSQLDSYPADSGINPSERFVFTDSKGEHMTINMIYKPFKQIAKQIGLGDMRFHDLRHTYAMLSLQSGCDIKTLSSNLGHATSAFTLDRYGHVSEEMHALSSSRMQRLIESLTGGCKRNEVSAEPPVEE